MNVIYVRSDLLTESFIELRIAVEFLSERNYGYEILTHSLTQSINRLSYADAQCARRKLREGSVWRRKSAKSACWRC